MSDDIEPFGDSELLETAGEFPGAGADAALPEVDRFRAGVSRLVAKTRAGRDHASTPPHRLGVILLHPGGPSEEALAQLKAPSHRAPMLDQGREPLHGRVWFVSHVVVAGTWVQIDYNSDEDLFNIVTDTLALGAVPAVVYDVGDPEPELRFYPNGLDSAEDYEPLRIAYTEINPSDVFERIEAVYRQFLVTPGVQSRSARLWEDADKLRASSQAEERLGGVLAPALQASFLTCKVRVEQPQPTGRLDIEIEERILGQPGTVRRHIVVELKVLRGVGTRGGHMPPKRIREQIADGVTQAAAYRDDRDAIAAALCCFDMRGGGPTHCFGHVLEVAEAVGVHLRSWYLFNSSAAYRRHLASSGALNAGVGA